MDYTKIKKTLLAEYETNGGTDTREFLRGMNYLEDYLESGRDDHGLNADVDEVAFLRSRVEQLQQDITLLERNLKEKRHVIKQYRTMTKDERYRWKASQETIRLEAVYARMVMELEEKYKRKRFKYNPTERDEADSDTPKGRKIYKSSFNN